MARRALAGQSGDSKRRRRGLEKAETRWLGIAVALLIAIAGIVVWQLEQRRLAGDLLRHTSAIHALVDTIETDVQDADIGATAYLLTGDEEYLSDYYSATRQLPRGLAELRDIVKGNAGQSYLAAELEAQIAIWVRLSDEVVDLRGKESLLAAAELYRGGSGKLLMDDMRKTLTALDVHEGTMELLRGTEYNRRLTFTNIALAALLGFCTIIMLLALGLIRRHSRLREMAEAQLREREQRLRLAVEAATAGACDLDITQQCIRFSGKASQIFDLGEATEVMLEDFLTKLHPDDAARVSAMFDAAACGHGHYQEEFRVVLNHGATRWIHLRMAPHLQTDEPPRIVGIAIDITLAKTAQIQIQDLLAQTQELLAQKETLVREIDHRVKNSLQLAASTLSAQARSERDPRVRRGLRHAEQRLFAMAQVHKIIQEAEHVGEVRLGDQIEQLATEFNQLSDSVVHIETYGDDVCLPARKAVSLSVIVNELLMNVLKHTASQEQVHVQIEWRLRESELFLTLRDDGPGMTEGAANGFGSRMISALVVQLAGSLTVHSDPKGTCYEIIVPLDHLNAVPREVTGMRKPRSR